MKDQDLKQIDVPQKILSPDELAQYRAAVERNKVKRNAIETKQQEARLMGKLARGEA